MQDVRFVVPGLKALDLENPARPPAVDAKAAAASVMADPEIGLPDLLVLRHRGIVALGENAAAGQHGDRSGRGRRRPCRLCSTIRIGAVGRDAADELGGALDVLVAHAGHRFVEQHHFGIDGERRGEFERPLAAIGDFARLGVRPAREADVVEQRQRARVERNRGPTSSARNRRNRRACAARRCARSRAR